MKTILLAFTLADTLNQTPETLIEEIKTQLGFKMDMEQVKIKHLEMTDTNNLTSEELMLIMGEPLASEAIYAFIASAANSKEAISLSKRKDPAPALAIAASLIAANNWDEPREAWEKNIEFPALNEDLDLRKKEFTSVLFKKEVKTPSPVTTPAATTDGGESTTQNTPAADLANELSENPVQPAPVVDEETAAGAGEPGVADDDPFKGSE